MRQVSAPIRTSEMKSRSGTTRARNSNFGGYDDFGKDNKISLDEFFNKGTPSVELLKSRMLNTIKLLINPYQIFTVLPGEKLLHKPILLDNINIFVFSGHRFEKIKNSLEKGIFDTSRSYFIVVS